MSTLLQNRLDEANATIINLAAIVKYHAVRLGLEHKDTPIPFENLPTWVDNTLHRISSIKEAQ